MSLKRTGERTDRSPVDPEAPWRHLDGSTNLNWMAKTEDELTDKGGNPGAKKVVTEIVSLYGGQSLRFVAGMNSGELWDAFLKAGNNAGTLLESRGYVDPLKAQRSA